MTALTIYCFGLLVISGLYFIIIFLIDIGIFKLKPFVRSTEQAGTRVSVIIPARNEEESIGNCLSDFESQDYPKYLFEVVVVNDHSTDRTEERVLEFARLHPDMNLKMIQTGDRGEGQAFKKHSIRAGIEATTGELVITTDADTRSATGWISSVVNFYEQSHPEMILGPVAFHEADSLFERMQVLEFSGLMAATAGSCRMGFPLMCNGANLAFKRKAYFAVADTGDDLKYPSGDDLFLMMKIRKKYGKGSIKYLFASETVVSTKAKRTPIEFFNQRLRWVSKSRGYTDPVILTVSILTWLFNFLLVSTLVAGIFNLQLFFLFLLLAGMKMVFEFPSVYRIMNLCGGKRHMYLYPLVQVMNLVYVSVIGILGNVVSYEWKGRKIVTRRTPPPTPPPRGRGEKEGV
jgi:cellulose synthase/poly-beta-1,6-N-acetylglucosamine synthase-like glycosyltransferase